MTRNDRRELREGEDPDPVPMERLLVGGVRVVLGPGRGPPQVGGHDETFRSVHQRADRVEEQPRKGGRLDTEGVKEVVRTMSGGVSSKPALDTPQARESFVEAIRGLDEALHASSLATHTALQTLVAHGKDFSDNDLKNAFAALQELGR